MREEGDPVYFHHIRQNKPVGQIVWQNNDTATPEKLAGRWLYLGGIIPHFGHFIAECIHRVWAWSYHKNECEGVIYLPEPLLFQKNKHVPTYCQEM